MAKYFAINKENHSSNCIDLCRTKEDKEEEDEAGE